MRNLKVEGSLYWQVSFSNQEPQSELIAWKPKCRKQVRLYSQMKIAAKEAGGTQYCLMLCDYGANYPECKLVINKFEEINKVLGKILSTSKKEPNWLFSQVFYFLSIIEPMKD